MNQYRCETCMNLKCIWNHENPHAYSGIFPKRKKTLAAAWANNFMVKVGCASHSNFQRERDKVLDELDMYLDGELERASQFNAMGTFALLEVKRKIKGLRQKAGEP